MKKLISLCLVVLLAVSTLSVALAADEPQYDNTRYFLAALDDAGHSYTYSVADSGDDKVVVKYKNGDSTCTIVCFFDDNNRVSLYAWGITDYSNEANAYKVCNQLNYDYLFIRFYADTSDNSISAQMDFPLHDGVDNSAEVLRSINLMVLVIEAAEDSLSAL